MKVSVLGSSSRGNSILVRHNDTTILVDSGLSLRHTVKNLEAVGSSLDAVDTVLVTHGHIDHVRSLRTVADGKMVLSTPGTLRTLEGTNGYRKLSLDYGEKTDIGSMKVKPFAVPHDCRGQPCGFVIEAGNKRIGIAMDLGRVTDEVTRNLQGCTGIVMESNHDPEMLFQSSRPVWLINRILGPVGHLSNAECAEALDRIVDERTKWVALTHLSQKCNHPEKALAEIAGIAKENNVNFQVAHPTLPTNMKEVVKNEGIDP